jgi:hypothetical protein
MPLAYADESIACTRRGYQTKDLASIEQYYAESTYPKNAGNRSFFNQRITKIQHIDQSPG